MIIKCKMCGGDLQPSEGAVTCECEFCGTTQTVPVADNEKKANLFNRANRLRMSSEFDRAAAVYESIVAEFPGEAEGYWGLLLCKYGIEYVDDPATGKKVPTCHRTNSVSIMEDDNYNRAWDCADALARRVYREEAKAIDQLQQSILAIVQKEEPYDVFICYKETGADGQRTEDSVLSQEIYDALTTKGMKVFFARITLEDKLGQQYEPYIYAALHSAKVMLAVGTSFEHYDAVWVKNEWSRFLAMAASDKEKVLIPCYKHVDAYDMPKEFRNLQAQDMAKIGWLQDLTRGVEKLCGKNLHGATVVQQVVQQGPSAAETVEALLRRAFLFLESKDWKSADEYCERVLDAEPENARAYLGKLMAQQQVSKAEELAECKQPFDESDSYQKAYRFAGSNLKADLGSYAKVVRDRLHREQIAALYNRAEKLAAKAKKPRQCLKAAELYKQAGDYKDASKKEYECRQKAKVLAEKLKRRRIIRVMLLLLFAVAIVSAKFYFIPEYHYRKAEALMAEGKFTEASELFAELGSYSDAEQRALEPYYVQAEALLMEKDYDGAYAAFKRAGEYSDAAERVLEPYYAHGKELLEADDYAGAIAAFQKAGDYADASLLLPQCWYMQGMALLQAGQNGPAVAAFAHAGHYQDATEQVDKLRSELMQYYFEKGSILGAGYNHSVARQWDGTVLATGSNSNSQCDVSKWCDIVSIVAGNVHTVGLRLDGTVVATGSNYDGQCNVATWHDIMAVSAGSWHTVGLKSDGTVVAVGRNTSGQCNVQEWRDIIAVSAGPYHTVGLKSDGTVVAVGLNSEGQCEVGAWRDIIAIAVGEEHTVGLKSSNTMVAVGRNNYGQCDVTEWKDIKKISVGSYYTLGLRNDGTVIATGYNGVGQCDVTTWTDVIAIEAGGSHALGLKRDGTLYVTKYNNVHQGDVGAWSLFE